MGEGWRTIPPGDRTRYPKPHSHTCCYRMDFVSFTLIRRTFVRFEVEYPFSTTTQQIERKLIFLTHRTDTFVS